MPLLLFLLLLLAPTLTLQASSPRLPNDTAAPAATLHKAERQGVLRREMGAKIFAPLAATPAAEKEAQHHWPTPFVAIPPQGREVRAVWLCTLGGMDWPSGVFATTAAKAESQRQALRKQLDALQAIGINTILFQTRIRSTVAYPSRFEPWDGAFSGTIGQAPPYDVLEFAIAEAHARGMELHAYLVAFPLCTVAQEKQLGRLSLPRRRPELCQRCGNRWMMDPGVPQTAHYLASLAREITERYDIDGLHLDYIRYPERDIAFDDQRTYQRYGGRQPKAQWRRDNVSRCVRAVAEAVRTVKPWVKLSCSPIGKYADLPRQSAGGWNARDAVAQDAQLWLREGWMDMLLPMLYFDAEHFYPFALDWQQASLGRIVAPGLAAYFLSPKEGRWGLDVLTRQLNFSRSMGAGGQAFFRSQFLLDNHRGIYDYLRDFYAQPALPPALTWRDSIPPVAPTALHMDQHSTAIDLSWQAVSEATPITYNLYQRRATGWTLLAPRLRSCRFRYVPALPALLQAPLALTSCDAYGNESPLVCF